jgi:hypothetical protein
MSITVDHSLQEAIREFQGALTQDQKAQLRAIKAVPDAAAVITFTAQLDEKNAQRRTSGVATRLYLPRGWNLRPISVPLVPKFLAFDRD